MAGKRKTMEQIRNILRQKINGTPIRAIVRHLLICLFFKYLYLMGISFAQYRSLLRNCAFKV